MANEDKTPHDSAQDSADTASFQRFMDEQRSGTTNDGRSFRLLSLLVGAIVLLAVVFLLVR